MRHAATVTFWPLHAPPSVWQVALASTPLAIRRGLAGTPVARAGEGMLFDLRRDPRPHTFTTMGMLFSLDFALLRGGRVIAGYYNVPPGVPQVFSQQVEYVLETPAGRLPGLLPGATYQIS